MFSCVLRRMGLSKRAACIAVTGMFSVLASADIADPTRPSYFQTKISKKTLQVSSILHSGSRKVAVINGVAVTEGEMVEGATVLKINKNNVRVKSNEKVMSLVLRTPMIRQER